MSIKEFQLTEKTEETIFAMFVMPTTELQDVCMVLNSTEVIDIQLLKEYEDYADIFSETETSKFPEFIRVEHMISVEEDKKISFGPIYKLSENELGILCEYLASNIAKKWIQHSESPAEASILFILKKDNILCLCVDYHDLNQVTIQNRYSLSLIDEILDHLNEVKHFIRFDIGDIYHRIGIKREDEGKTTFHIRYGHYKYLMMPFGLINVSATFQVYINEILRELLDIYYIAFLNDIMIYSEDPEEHMIYMRMIFKKLRQYRLFVKLSKCEFYIEKMDFLRYCIGIIDISMNICRIVIILEWPVLKFFHDIQVFIGFTNFYRRFIHSYSIVIVFLTDLLKNMKKEKKSEPFEGSQKTEDIFRILQDCFTYTSLLQYFKSERSSQLKTDIYMQEISGILS